MSSHATPKKKIFDPHKFDNSDAYSRSIRRVNIRERVRTITTLATIDS